MMWEVSISHVHKGLLNDLKTFAFLVEEWATEGWRIQTVYPYLAGLTFIKVRPQP